MWWSRWCAGFLLVVYFLSHDSLTLSLTRLLYPVLLFVSSCCDESAQSCLVFSFSTEVFFSYCSGFVNWTPVLFATLFFVCECDSSLPSRQSRTSVIVLMIDPTVHAAFKIVIIPSRVLRKSDWMKYIYMRLSYLKNAVFLISDSSAPFDRVTSPPFLLLFTYRVNT